MNMRDLMLIVEGRDRHIVPEFLYHATYQPYMAAIGLQGLHGNNQRKNWEDSKHGAIYLATTPEAAYSYADASDDVPEEWLELIIVLRITSGLLDLSKLQNDPNVIDGSDTFEYEGVIPISAVQRLK